MFSVSVRLNNGLFLFVIFDFPFFGSSSVVLNKHFFKDYSVLVLLSVFVFFVFKSISFLFLSFFILHFTLDLIWGYIYIYIIMLYIAYQARLLLIDFPIRMNWWN